MRHYTQCFLAYFKSNLLTWTEYKLDFIATNLANIILICVAIINIEIIFTQVDNIHGWSKYHILWMLGFYQLVKVIWNTFFINTIDIGYWVRTGKLDIFMVRPLNCLFQITCSERYNTEFSLDELLIGLSLLFYTNHYLLIQWSGSYLIKFIICIISSVLIYGSIIFIVSSISLWTIQSKALFNIIANLEELIQYPIDIYGIAIKYILTLIIPLGFVSYYPSAYLFGNNNFKSIIFINPLVGLLLFSFGIFLWKIGLKSYQSTGS